VNSAVDVPFLPLIWNINPKMRCAKKLYKSYENIVVEENKATNYEQFINEMGLKIT
jgi:hypothetical protein